MSRKPTDTPEAEAVAPEAATAAPEVTTPARPPKATKTSRAEVMVLNLTRRAITLTKADGTGAYIGPKSSITITPDELTDSFDRAVVQGRVRIVS